MSNPAAATKTKPFVEMTKKELNAAFAELGLTTTFQLLQEARRGKNQEITLAAAVLRSASGFEWFVLVTNESGDKDGIRNVEHFCEECRSFPGLLLPGETIRCVVMRVTGWLPVQTPQAQTESARG